MKKTYILDTNILLSSPDCILGFKDNDVCITEVTVEELDPKKRDSNKEIAYNARKVSRLIKELRKKGNLLEGVPLPEGGTFKVIRLGNDNIPELPNGWQKDKPDNLILLTVEKFKKTCNSPCVLITNDFNMQIKADCLNIETQDYQNERIADDIDFYRGRSDYSVYANVIDELYRNKTIPVTDIVFFEYDTYNELIPPIFHENEFVVLYALENKKKSILLKYKKGNLLTLEYVDKVETISPLNTGQEFALEALMAPASEIPLVFLEGSAGTAKTFLSMAIGLEKALNEDEYKRVLLCRPNSKFDDDIGYLKGDEMEKIAPLIRPFYDNLEALLEKQGYSYTEIPDIIDDYFYRQVIKAEAMAYMRGRSITNTFIIVDEAQNATPNQILGMITRAGKGSKIVIVGDPNQIDEAKLDKRNNGLVFAAEKMKNSSLSASVFFKESECVRSDLAMEASQLLTAPSEIVY